MFLQGGRGCGRRLGVGGLRTLGRRAYTFNGGIGGGEEIAVSM